MPKRVSKHRRISRKGAVIVLSAMLMVVLFGMVAFALDVGSMLCARTEAQRAVDSGAFAGAGALPDGIDVARSTARTYVEQNVVLGRTVASNELRIEFGEWNDATRSFETWADQPTAVRVAINRPDQPLSFGRVFGQKHFPVRAEAIATYAPRDIVVVLDYSASMNDDSELKHISRLGRTQVEKNLLDIYTELGSPQFGNMQWSPVSISSDDASVIKQTLGLTNVPYPFPSGSWDDYIRYVQSSSTIYSAGYRRKYGYLTLVNYWLERKPSAHETPDLWKTSEQPISAVKDALAVFLGYLQQVDTNDRVGLAVYTSKDGRGKLESPLTGDYARIEYISRHRQAGHYHRYTNIGAGMQKARIELEQNGREGALKMIVLMTDGIANRPSDASTAKAFVREEARLAAAGEFPTVTVSLGSAADKDLMQEVADVTGGIHFNIPGGQSVAAYEEDLKEVFRKIAGHRPLKLVQ
jgi:hypothetical protein